MANPWDKPTATPATQGNPWDKPTDGGAAPTNDATPEQPGFFKKIQMAVDRAAQPEPLEPSQPAWPQRIASGMVRDVVQPLVHPEQALDRELKNLTGHSQATVPGKATYDEAKKIGWAPALERDAGGLGAMVGLGGMAEPTAAAIDSIPSRARASRTFADIENAAKDVPVSMAKTQPALDEFGQSVKTGGKNAPVMTKLKNRITPPAPKQPGMLQSMQSELNGTPSMAAEPQPINFPEARDFYTNISRATAKPGFLRRAIENPGAPAFRMNAGNVRSALNDDLTDAAGTIGRGEDYSGAMTEYRRAAQLNHAMKTGAKMAVPAALGAAGYSGVKKFLPF